MDLVLADVADTVTQHCVYDIQVSHRLSIPTDSQPRSVQILKKGVRKLEFEDESFMD